MAESQHPFSYDASSARLLEAQLSSKRFATYLKKAGYNDEFALQLYLYNARLAKAFLFPLHIVEIVLRNGIDEVLCSNFNHVWHVNSEFLSLLTSQSLATLEKAKARASRKGKPSQKDDVVSRLTLDFWSNLFRAEYDRRLWQTNIKQLFPRQPGITRASLQRLVLSINQFRNRIAHHEPIFMQDVSLAYRQIIEIVSYRCATTEAWLRSHSTVHQIMRTKPSPAKYCAGMLQTDCDSNIAIISEPLTPAVLTHARQIRSRYIIVTDDTGRPKGVIDTTGL